MYKTHGPRAAMSVGREEGRDDHEPKRGSLQGSRKASVMGPVRGGSQDCLVVSVNDTHTHTSLFRQTQRGGTATVVCEASEIREHDEALVFRDIIPFLSHRFLCSPHNRHFGRKPNGHIQLLWWLKRPGQLVLR